LSYAREHQDADAFYAVLFTRASFDRCSHRSASFCKNEVSQAIGDSFVGVAWRGPFSMGHLVLLLIVRISHAGTISFGVLLIALSLSDVAGKTAQFAFTGVVLLLSILGFPGSGLA
jgi:hypothetical protein